MVLVTYCNNGKSVGRRYFLFGKRPPLVENLAGEVNILSLICRQRKLAIILIKHEVLKHENTVES